MILTFWTMCRVYGILATCPLYESWVFFRVVSMKMCLSQVRHDDVWDKQYISLLIYHKHQPFMQAKIYHTPGDSIRDLTWFPNLNVKKLWDFLIKYTDPGFFCPTKQHLGHLRRYSPGGCLWARVRRTSRNFTQKSDEHSFSPSSCFATNLSDTVDPAPIWCTKRELYIYTN